MGVLKADKVPAQRISAFSMADIENQARAILAAAKARAERLLMEAQQEAQEIKRIAHAQALEEGKREGIAQGLEQGKKQGREAALTERRQELAKLVGALVQAAQDLDGSRLQFDADARRAVVELAIAIAGRVARRQGALDPQVMLSNVEEALKLVVHSRDIRIAIHPSQKTSLEEALPAIQAKWPALKHIELVADGTLAPGGCRVFTGGGQIDADLELQLNRIAAELVPGEE